MKFRDMTFGDLGNAISSLFRRRTETKFNIPGFTYGGPGAGSYPYAWAFGHGQSLESSSKISSEPYTNHSIIAMGFQTLVEDAVSVGWRLKDRASEELIEDDKIHPVMRVFQSPNPEMFGAQLWTGTYLSYEVFGETIWYYPDLILPTGLPGLSDVDNVFSDQRRIDILDPRLIQTKRADDGGLDYFKRTPTGAFILLKRERVTHFKRWNPYNPDRGLSKITAMLAEIEGDYYAARWNRRFFNEQNAVPSGLLLPTSQDAMDDLDEPQRDQMLASFKSSHGGSRRSVGILPHGWDWKDLGINQRDMDFKALRQYSREIILSMIGVPPFRAGVLDNANYANSRAQDEVYWGGTIKRFLSNIRDTLNADFLPTIGVLDVYLEPNWAEIDQLLEDLKEKVETAKVLWEMGVPLSKLNERLDMGFDLDGVEGADMAFISGRANTVANVVSGSLMIGPRGGIRRNEDEDEDQEQDQEEDSDDPGKSFRATSREAKRTLRWKQYMAQFADVEKKFAGRARSHFKDIEKEVLKNLSGLKGLLTQIGEQNEQKNIERIIFNRTLADERIRKATTALYREAVRRGGNGLMTEIGVEINFDMSRPDVQSVLATLSQQIANINDSLETTLRKELVEGLSKGETIALLSERVKKVMGNRIKSTAQTIARTETGKAFSQARHAAMKQAKIKKHEWLSSRDPEVRETHAAEDGNVVRVGDTFPITGLQYPLESSGPPEEVINCRCIAVPV